MYLYAADLTLEQSAGPTTSDVGGEVASAPVLSGTSDLTFDASDPGSGVYEAVFSVDGQVVQSTVLDEDGGRCRNVGQTTDGLPAFLYLQPCPASLSADVGFDTTRVGNGVHHLVVTVTDAAGNSTYVLDRNVTIENAAAPGGPNGVNASPQATLSVAWKGMRSARLVSGYGRAETILGRLTDAGGAPISGARVDVLATPDYAGARTAAMAGVVTNGDGEFTLRLPAGLSSRTLRFEYSDELGARPVTTRTLTLDVRAGVSLRVSPRTVDAGGSIHFTGRLRGGPVPKGGKLLVLEARSPGGAWLEFDVIRSDAHGGFHASYRFKFPGPAAYQFRVLCEGEADYPFASGASNVVGVFERE
ncbi:MAG TPA: carboxypeptidase regulatory-like domain-containing protein [Solirubrobacteraceae bacterium]|nr:carboxypeptidase regulatory-like domain-containing protein [Solirubrobacteraceae bacterium]